MRKTFIASILFHICLVTAVLALSAGLFGGSSERPSEGVMFVNLIKEMLETTDQRPLVEPANSELKKPVRIEQESQLPVIKQKEAVTVVEKNPEAVIKDEPEAIKTLAAYEADENISAKAEDGIVDTDIPSDSNKEAFYASAEVIPGKGDFDIKGKGFLPPDSAAIIRALIEKAKVYPLIARKRGIEGTTYINFKITRDGKPEDLQIARGSGSRILDEATIKIVKKAAPFPHIDNRVEVPVAFRLKN